MELKNPIPRLWIQIMAVVLLYRLFCSEASQQCGSETSILGKMLRRHTFRKIKTTNGFECYMACHADVRCQSFNYVITNDMCELNNRTKEARPEDFVPNLERYYMKRDTNLVPLGSIPELPGESCKEIKSSEGLLVVSGKYWLDSIIPGRAVLASCDMNTEDVDECSSSIPICHANASCQNTVGSFTCTCHDGFSGDGRDCTDIDECSDGSHACDVHDNCTNTFGSYKCTCISTPSGDGKNCTAYRGLGSSSILGTLDHKKYLGRLMSFLVPVLMSPKLSRFERCYHAKTDGWATSTFHSKCDGKGPTVTIIQVNQYVFGGYTDVSWYSSCGYRAASKAFIYSLFNKRGYYPVKLHQYRYLHTAMYSCSSYGPTFGAHDIYISDNATNNKYSYTYSYTYYPPIDCTFRSWCRFYVGSYRFSPTDIEVFYEAT